MIVGEAIGGSGVALAVGSEDLLVDAERPMADVWGLLIAVEGLLVGVEGLLVGIEGCLAVLTVDVLVLSSVDDFADVLRDREPGAGVLGLEV